MRFLPRRAELGYIAGGGTAALLFIFHTLVIFEMAYLLTLVVEDAIHVLGLHIAGPTIILCGFLVLFVAHIVEAAVWAMVLWKLGELPTFGEAVYFTGTSLTALGYGDIVLHAPYRMLGPIMATSGILMFGCSAAFLFFVIQRVWQTMG
jgi:hypothetical protein